MDYNRLLAASFSWFSLDKVFWFIALFWVSLPFIVTLPQLFQTGAVYSDVTLPIAVILYDVLYVILFFGIVLLIQSCLSPKTGVSKEFGLRRVVDLVFLVFLEMFYVFVWNISVRLRKVQLLLIIAAALFWLLFISSFNIFILIIFS